MDHYRIEQDGAWYVMDRATDLHVSPPMRSREAALTLAGQCEALPEEERSRLRRGLRPAPGCEWLIRRAGETAREASVRFEIRDHDCTGATLATVEVDVDEHGRAAGGGGAIEAAAAFAAHTSPEVRRYFGIRRACGANRETGVPGMSGIFSLRVHGAHAGQIHVRAS